MLNRRELMALSAAGGACLVLPSAALGRELTVEEVLRDPAAPVLGNPNGDVTVVEYFDYQCPYCKKAWPEVMAAVRADGNTRLVMKDWPIFGPASFRAARLALAAMPSGDYAKAHQALMQTKGSLSESGVDAVLRRAGLDAGRLADAYAEQRGRIDGLLGRNNVQAEAFGFQGTPSYVVETTLYPGVMSKSDLAQAIREARAG